MTLTEAIRSYIFSLILVGDKIPMTEYSYRMLESRAHSAFYRELGQARVVLTPSYFDNSLSVHLV